MRAPKCILGSTNVDNKLGNKSIATVSTYNHTYLLHIVPFVEKHSFESYPGDDRRYGGSVGVGGGSGGGGGGGGEQEDSRMSRDSKQPSLTRSLTDSNISYSGEEFPEAAGASGYVNKDGDIDLLVVLQVRVRNTFVYRNFCLQFSYYEYKYSYARALPNELHVFCL